MLDFISLYSISEAKLYKRSTVQAQTLILCIIYL